MKLRIQLTNELLRHLEEQTLLPLVHLEYCAEVKQQEGADFLELPAEYAVTNRRGEYEDAEQQKGQQLRKE